MKKLIYLLLVIILFTGCTKDEPGDSFFTLSKIEYYLDDGDGTKEETEHTEHPVYENNSNEAIEYYIHSIDEWVNTSRFIFDDDITTEYRYDPEEYIFTPSHVEEEYGIFYNSTKYFTFDPWNEQEVPSNTRFRSKTTLHPNAKISHICDITREVTRVSFRAIFTGNVTGDKIYLKGKWVGSQEMSNTYCRIVVSDITD